MKKIKIKTKLGLRRSTLRECQLGAERKVIGKHKHDQKRLENIFAKDKKDKNLNQTRHSKLCEFCI